MYAAYKTCRNPHLSKSSSLPLLIREPAARNSTLICSAIQSTKLRCVHEPRIQRNALGGYATGRFSSLPTCLGLFKILNCRVLSSLSLTSTYTQAASVSLNTARHRRSSSQTVHARPFVRLLTCVCGADLSQTFPKAACANILRTKRLSDAPIVPVTAMRGPMLSAVGLTPSAVV